MDLSKGKLLNKKEDLQVAMKDIPPGNGVPFCPYQPPHQIPRQVGSVLNVIRLMQPCSVECALHPNKGGGCPTSFKGDPITDLKVS